MSLNLVFIHINDGLTDRQSLLRRIQKIYINKKGLSIDIQKINNWRVFVLNRYSLYAIIRCTQVQYDESRASYFP